MNLKKFAFIKIVNIHYRGIKNLFVILLLLLPGNILVSINAQSLSLEQRIDTALLYNRNIRLAQHDVNISTEKNREIKGNLLPKLNGIADYRYYTDLPYQLMPAAAFGGLAGTYNEVQFGVPQNLNGDLQLAVPLFNGRITQHKIAGKKIEIEKSDIQKELVTEKSRLDLRNAELEYSLANKNIIVMSSQSLRSWD